MAKLFDSLTLGALTLPNRLIMSPRSRAGKSRVPNGFMAEYYIQRASARLFI